jgi:AcrR family transcriptional regulator
MADRQNTRPDARQRLISAAIAIFAENGFDGTTTRTLADKAQVNLSAIPYYFRGKEGLYHAAVTHIADILSARLDPFLRQIEGRTPSDLDPAAARKLVRQGLTTMVAVMCGDPSAQHFMQIILREQMTPTPAFDLIYPRVMKRVLAAFATLIAAATGETDKRQCRLQAVLFIGQVVVFRVGRATVVRRLGMKGYTEGEIAEIQAAVVSRAMAALDFMASQHQ